LTERRTAPNGRPLCASMLVENLRWFFGWDTETLDPDIIAMLHA
jgi:hypothetical protein